MYYKCVFDKEKLEFMKKRLNVLLPEETVALIDSVSQKGERSQLIDKAIHFYIEAKTRENLRAQLKEGAQVHTQRDQQLAGEWFSLEPDLGLND